MALIAVLGWGFSRDPALVSSPLIERPAPAFDLATLDGARVKLASLRGRPVIVNFWASWCRPCRDEAPLLARVDAAYRARGLAVVGIVFEDDAGAARAFMGRYSQTYPGLLDPDGRAALDYGVFGIPETYFIDARGIIVSKQTGQLDWDALERQTLAIVP